MSQNDYPVIDADGYAVESNELFDRYLDKQFRHQAPRMDPDAGGAAFYKLG